MPETLPTLETVPTMMKTSTLLIALAACCANAFGAASSKTVLLETPVTYHPDASVSEQVRKECKIEDMLALRVGAVLDRVNKKPNSTVAAGTPTGDASVLRLQITYVLGVGGGAWSGPKAITVAAELIDDGKVSRQTKINRWTSGGMFGGFKGTCALLDRSATAIGKDLGRWVRDPSYKIAEEPEPKQPADAASSAASEPAAAL
jgi:hypothetical protein